MGNILIAFGLGILVTIIVSLIWKVLSGKKRVQVQKEEIDQVLEGITSDEQKDALRTAEEAISSIQEKGYDLEDLVSLELKIKHALNLGYIYWKENKIEDAIKLTEKALDFGPDGELLAITKSNLAYYYAKALILGQREKAVEYANFVKERFRDYPNRLSWLINYAYVKYRYARDMNEINEAETFLNEIRNREDADEKIREEIDRYLTEIQEKREKISTTQ